MGERCVSFGRRVVLSCVLCTTGCEARHNEVEAVIQLLHRVKESGERELGVESIRKV